MRGYLDAHAGLERIRRTLDMDVYRIAAHADVDGYAKAQRSLLAVPDARQDAADAEPAWQRARRAFERAGLVVQAPQGSGQASDPGA